MPIRLRGAGIAPGAGTWRSRRALLLSLCVAVFVAQAVELDYVVDDAFITFRYARNLVDGHGLTFNPGGPRVEGYTSPAWTLLAAGALGAGADPRGVTRALGILAGVGLLLLAERLARECGAGRWSVLAAALLAVNPALVTWSAASMETSFFAALVVLAALLTVRAGVPPWTAGVVLSLACLTRPEGVLVVALVALVVLAAEGWTGLRRRGGTFWPVLLVVGTHVAWRYAYYGALLPNTFYAKTGDLPAQVAAGLSYLLGGIGALAGGPLLGVLLALSFRRRDVASALPPTLVLGWLAYVLVIGGDGLPHHRFLVPAFPFLAVVLSVVLSESLGDRPIAAPSAALAALLLTALLGRHGRAYEYREWDRTVFVPKVVRVGQQLRALVGGNARIALQPAGAIPYLSGLETVDMLALNDPVVARKSMRFTAKKAGHWKYDAREVLRQSPEYVLLGNVDVTDEPRVGVIPPIGAVEFELMQLPGFQADYRLVALPLTGGGYLNCYRRVARPREVGAAR